MNNLTPAERERLDLLTEECAEVIHMVSKIQRHGYESYHPEDDTYNNRELLQKEIGDLMAVLDMMFMCEDINKEFVTYCVEDKFKRVGKYLHHNNIEDME